MTMNESDIDSIRIYFPMQFYFGYHNVKVLFKGWEINSVGALIASVAGVFLLALIYEALKSFRILLHHNRSKILTKAKCYLSVQYKKLYSSVEVIPEIPESAPASIPSHVTIGVNIIQTLLYTVQITLGYFLMLIAMTFNAWLFIAIIVGAGIGYLCFGNCAYHQHPATNNNKMISLTI